MTFFLLNDFLSNNIVVGPARTKNMIDCLEGCKLIKDLFSIDTKIVAELVAPMIKLSIEDFNSLLHLLFSEKHIGLSQPVLDIFLSGVTKKFNNFKETNGVNEYSAFLQSLNSMFTILNWQDQVEMHQIAGIYVIDGIIFVNKMSDIDFSGAENFRWNHKQALYVETFNDWETQEEISKVNSDVYETYISVLKACSQSLKEEKKTPEAYEFLKSVHTREPDDINVAIEEHE